MITEGKADVLELARNVIATEIDALQRMSTRLNGEFRKTIKIILEARGRVGGRAVLRFRVLTGRQIRSALVWT